MVASASSDGSIGIIHQEADGSFVEDKASLCHSRLTGHKRPLIGIRCLCCEVVYWHMG